MVLLPEVLTDGEPVVVPEYFAVGTEMMTTPEPPLAPFGLAAISEPPPPPPPVLTVPATEVVRLNPAPVPPPPEPPGPPT